MVISFDIRSKIGEKVQVLSRKTCYCVCVLGGGLLIGNIF